MEEVSHAQIYERLLAVEQKVSDLDVHTKDIVIAFEAAQGAFKALEFIARITKPLITIGTFLGAMYLAVQSSIKH